MSKFIIESPTDLIKQLNELEIDAENMVKDMTTEGAKVVEENIRRNAPESFKSSDIMNCLKITKAYENGRGAIGNRIAFFGYFTNHLKQRIPAPLVANVFEYGKKGFNKQPFVRKSFNKIEIENAMKKVQDRYLPKE